MNYAGWKLFVDAIELGSLSKVAVAYGTSQPHVSRQIGELERECGGRLFQRTGRGVVLTELGERVAPKVRAWLASTDQLANDIHTTAGKPIGRVRLGILPSAAHPLVSTLCRRLQERYPLVQLSVREGQGAQLETWLENGSLDLAILFRHSDPPRNGDVYLVETSTYLVSADGDPLTAKPTVPFAKLHNLPLVQFCRPNSWRDRLDELAHQRGVTLNVDARGRFAGPADAHGGRRRHVRVVGTVRRVRGVEGSADSFVTAGRAHDQAPHRARDVASRRAHACGADRDARNAGHRAQRRGCEGAGVKEHRNTLSDGNERRDARGVRFPGSLRRR